MAKATATSTAQHETKPLAHYAPHLLVGLALLLIAYDLLVQPIGAFPADWNIGLRGPLDEFKKWVVGNRATSPAFLYFFDPISDGMDFVIRQAGAFLLWLPWPVVIGAALLLTGLTQSWSSRAPPARPCAATARTRESPPP